MNQALLKKHVKRYLTKLKENPEKHEQELREREERIAYYRSWSKDRILKMGEEDFLNYLSQLWAMLIWGNKQYAVDRIFEHHGISIVRKELAEFVWSDSAIETRWDRFKREIKGMGPAMISEILCHAHPDDYILWNRRAYVGFHYLGVPDLPRHNYQMTGKKFAELCSIAKEIAAVLKEEGVENPNLLTVDYFIWDELQVESNLNQMFKKGEIEKEAPEIEKKNSEEATFIHNEIRDKIADIGRWLGFDSQIEIKVASGSKVDTIWEATIGNMGRIIYAFEVQTKGSIDSLIVNLFKCLNNPAVQGIVAVSDAKQLDTIKKHAFDIADLNKKLKYWDYQEVLQIHDALESVNESINKLGLVPDGFWQK